MKKQISLTLIIFSFLGFAQEHPLNLSLQEAIDYAIKNNTAAKNATLDIEAAKKQKWETTAIGLPQINANIDYNNWLKQQVSLLPGEIVGGQPGTFVPVAFGTKQSVNATATLKQLLFDGSYLVGLQSAKVFLEISKNAKEKTDLEVRKATINAYGNVLLSKESIAIYESNIVILKNNLRETTAIFENGLTEEENVEQLQITLKQITSGYKNAQRLNSIAHQMLNITLGTDLNTKVNLTETLEVLALKNVNLELLNSSDEIKNTIDYKIATNDKRAKELLLKLEKTKALPSLSAFINGGYSGNNEKFDFLNKEQQWFGSSLFGVSLNIPIFSSGQRAAKTQRARINLEKAENNLSETEQQLKFQVASAKSNYQFAIEQFNTSKESLTLAERIEKKNQIKFFEGITTSFDLRQAQQQLYSTQQEYLQAMLEVINNKVTLETLLNSIN
ncbi:MAG: TolC family protein [Flavobacteriaceae bacterium]|nr:TolC family protein [Flavobacteriaceae bacterium]